MSPTTRRLQKVMELFEAKQLMPALQEVRAVLQTQPNNFMALQLAGVICSDLGRHDEAISKLSRAVRVDRGSVQAHYNLGKAQAAAGQVHVGMQTYAAGLALDPRSPHLLSGMGHCLAELGRRQEAIESFKRALDQDAAFVDAQFGLGCTLKEIGNYEVAKKAFVQASKSGLFRRNAMLNAFQCERAMADWRDFPASREMMRGAAVDGSASPFDILQLFDDPDLQLRCANQVFRGAAQGSDAARSSRVDGMIRVAYLSADFRSHPTSHLLAGVIEQHDRSKLEVIGISTGGLLGNSEIGSRIRAAFDTFTDMAEASTEAIRNVLATMKIDIAVDLMGHTKLARPQLFRPRLAPVQINYLGYPATTGNPDMDFIVIDRFLAETFTSQHFSERALVLPVCYQPFDDRRLLAGETLSRAAYGLDPDAFVFCSFNEPSKVTPEVFDSWMRILQQSRSSQLWLYAPNPYVAENFRAEAGARGIEASRLVLCSTVAKVEHLARYGVADLFLDTFPYTAHTTAREALWNGCPIVTRVGQSFASRVAGSILHHAGLDDLITHDVEAYERLAVRLATDRDALRDVRERVARLALEPSTAGGTKAYTACLEAAFEQAIAEHSEAAR